MSLSRRIVEGPIPSARILAKISQALKDSIVFKAVIPSSVKSLKRKRGCDSTPAKLRKCERELRKFSLDSSSVKPSKSLRNKKSMFELKSYGSLGVLERGIDAIELGSATACEKSDVHGTTISQTSKTDDYQQDST